MQAGFGDQSATSILAPRLQCPVPLRYIKRRKKSDKDEQWARISASSGLCFNLPVDLKLAEQACREPAPLAKALGMMETLAQDKSRTEFALYLIQAGDDPIVKVGISSNPYRRLFELQNAHYRELSLWCVVFTPTTKAMTLEQRVLNWAIGRGSRLFGEWMNEEPADVFTQVMAFAEAEDIPVCDAEVWVHNFTQRVRRLAAMPRNLRNLINLEVCSELRVTGRRRY